MGRQFDVVRGPGKTLHLVSTRYYQLDDKGAVLVDEAVGDEQSGALFFPPAIAVGDDATVHLITRHAGNFESGFALRYRRRSAAGTWDRDYPVTSPVKRNYVVGAAWLKGGQVVLMSSQGGSNVWGDLHLWQAGASAASKLGTISGIWRADCDARLRGGGAILRLSSGKPDPGGTGAYLLWGAAGPQVVTNLRANSHLHKGTGRSGFADLYVDAKGTTHFSYGAEQAVLYNQYDASGAKRFSNDKELFSNLGSWHLKTGLSAVAASDDGKHVVVVALRTDGSKAAGDCDLLVARSSDGGQTFGAPLDLKKKTHGGEGRLRPKLVAIGSTFYLFYYDKALSAPSLATLTLPVDADGDGHDASADCDDTDPKVHPGAEERCNGVDDDCDGQTDEGCAKDAGTPDASATSDGSSPRDAATRDGSAADATSADVGAAPQHSISGGCGCQTASTRGAPLPLLILLAWLALRASSLLL